jgi:hypothetical protein
MIGELSGARKALVELLAGPNLGTHTAIYAEELLASSIDGSCDGLQLNGYKRAVSFFDGCFSAGD